MLFSLPFLFALGLPAQAQAPADPATVIAPFVGEEVAALVERVAVTLKINWDALGIDLSRARLRAPAIDDFQDAASFGSEDAIPVEPGRGWLLLIE